MNSSKPIHLFFSAILGFTLAAGFTVAASAQDAPDVGPHPPEPLKAMPPPSPSRAAVTVWQPGRMTVTLDPVPPQPSYLVIAENWYPDWQASADGRPAQVLRGDYTLITVALPAGAKVVDLMFRSNLYETGRALSLGSLAALLLALVAAVLLPHRTRHG